MTKFVGVLASFGVMKSVAAVNRKIIMTLTSDYEMEERTILYLEGVTRAEIESIVRQRYLRLPASKDENVGQTLFRMELLVAVSQVEETAELTVDPETEVEKIAVAVTSEPPNKTPPQLSIK